MPTDSVPPCPVCGRVQVRFFDERLQLEFWRCSEPKCKDNAPAVIEEDDEELDLWMFDPW